MIDYPAFYETNCCPTANVREFVTCLAKPDEQSRAKLPLLQGARMVWLADGIWEQVAKGRSPLQILFYVIAAEAVAKLVAGFQDEGASKRHVRKFFEEVCSHAHRDTLSNAFGDELGNPYTCREAVDLLYRVRCDVAHEAKYYLFSLPTNDDPTHQVNRVDGQTVQAFVTREQLRTIVIEGSLRGAAAMVPEGHKCFGLIDTLWNNS